MRQCRDASDFPIRGRDKYIFLRKLRIIFEIRTLIAKLGQSYHNFVLNIYSPTRIETVSIYRKIYGLLKPKVGVRQPPALRQSIRRMGAKNYKLCEKLDYVKDIYTEIRGKVRVREFRIFVSLN